MARTTRTVRIDRRDIAGTLVLFRLPWRLSDSIASAGMDRWADPEEDAALADYGRVLVEVAESLSPGGVQHVVVIVGGSLLAWHGLRDTTLDVDSARRLDEELVVAVVKVAATHGLDPRWFNAGAARFAPATLDIAECDRLLETPRLLVLGAPLRLVFVMKLSRAQPNDLADLVVLFSHTGFVSAAEAVEAFHDAYPHEEPDPGLAGLVIEIARRSGHALPRF